MLKVKELVVSGAEVECNYELRDGRPPPESPSRTASFKTVECQLREGEQLRTSKLSAIRLTPFGAPWSKKKREQTRLRLLPSIVTNNSKRPGPRAVSS